MSSYDIHPSTDRHPKNIDRVFFRSATHATDATVTGWIPHTAAASHAPGTPSRTRIRHTSTVFAACQTMFTAW